MLTHDYRVEMLFHCVVILCSKLSKCTRTQTVCYAVPHFLPPAGSVDKLGKFLSVPQTIEAFYLSSLTCSSFLSFIS